MAGPLNDLFFDKEKTLGILDKIISPAAKLLGVGGAASGSGGLVGKASKLIRSPLGVLAGGGLLGASITGGSSGEVGLGIVPEGGGGGGLLGGLPGADLLEELPIVGGLFDDGVDQNLMAAKQSGMRPKLETLVIATYPNGAVELRSRENGRPALMSRDVQRMKKTIRTIRKVDQRIPRRVSKPSAMSQLQNAVLQGAISTALKKD